LAEVLRRGKSEDPVDLELVEEIKKIPQIAFEMRRMVEKGWLDRDLGVREPEKVA